jgi:hypothetical protein
VLQPGNRRPLEIVEEACRRIRRKFGYKRRK